jgi:hypothetical protein
MNATLAVGGVSAERFAERLSGAIPEMPAPDHDLVELALVLPRWQVDALASAARGRGLTAGQALRRLIRGYCTGASGPER